MGERARKEVLCFKDQCKIVGGATGKDIQKTWVANRKAGNGQGADELCTSASPRKAAMWIREEDYMAYGGVGVPIRISLHAQAATKILTGPPVFSRAV